MKNILWILSAALLCSCATTTREGAVGVDRKQFMLLSSSEVVSLSKKGYAQTKQEAQKAGTLDTNRAQVARVQEIARRLIPHTAIFRADATSWAWEEHVITSNELNAYCMPGGKIMFYTALIEKLQLSDAEIAAVMGHEIAHALREHGRERMSEQMAQNIGMQALMIFGHVDPKYMGAGAMAANVALTLPHSRGQESEADTIGLELMARAGYNPEEAVTLWKKMGSQGGKKPPALLSTHPADDVRMHNIQALLPKVMPLYQAAQK